MSHNKWTITQVDTDTLVTHGLEIAVKNWGLLSREQQVDFERFSTIYLETLEHILQTKLKQFSPSVTVKVHRIF